MTARYAVYYAPQETDPLWTAGCAWLGRDPTGGETGPAPPVEGLAAIVAEASGYGFHATLKPPMRLLDGATRHDLLCAMSAVASCVPAFPLPPLVIANYHGFLCLREDGHAIAPSAALQALSDAMVAGLDALRAVPGEAELARRRAAGLSAAREANLRRWGYPDVFATWFFHMTISSRLSAEVAKTVQPIAQSWFAQALQTPRMVRDICLFEQREGGAFRLSARVPLAGSMQ